MVSGTANLVLHYIAGCCHLTNLTARSWSHCPSAVKVSLTIAVTSRVANNQLQPRQEAQLSQRDRAMLSVI